MGRPCGDSVPNSFSSLSSFCVAPKETIFIPLGPMIAIGNVDEQAPDNLFIFRRGGKIDRLVNVVRRRMVALGQPIFENLYLGRIGFRSNTHGERRNTVADEVVLIAAYEKIPQRLRIGLNAYSLRPGDLARATAK